MDPTAVVGGKVNVIGFERAARKERADGRRGRRERRSFLKLHLDRRGHNIDPSTWNHYRTLDALKAGFAEFCNRVPF